MEGRPTSLQHLHTCCVSAQVCILQRSLWGPITSQRRAKSVPIWRVGCFWRMHHYDPSWPHISQDSLCAQKRRKKERKWRHRMTQIVTFTGLGGRVGNAPKARPSHLTTADEVNKRPQRPSPSEDADPELRHGRCVLNTLFQPQSATSCLCSIFGESCTCS